MPRLTITITDEQAALLNEKTGDGGEYESKSEAVRHFIREYEHLTEDVEEREREREREYARELAERERRIARLETENERLRREKRMILEQREENQELQEYVEDEKRYRHAGLMTRMKWWLRGMD